MCGALVIQHGASALHRGLKLIASGFNKSRIGADLQCFMICSRPSACYGLVFLLQDEFTGYGRDVCVILMYCFSFVPFSFLVCYVCVSFFLVFLFYCNTTTTNFRNRWFLG